MTQITATAQRRPDAAPVNIRVKIAALWTAVLFLFVYVDLFTFSFRPDIRAEIEAGKVDAFTIDHRFLLATTAYILVPSLMVALTVLLPAMLTRWTNVVLAVLYAVTIIGAAVGEWSYFVLGSAVEVALLATLVAVAWRWPTTEGPA